MILIVGATGNLGGMIARKLLARGREVRILVRSGSQYQSLVEAGAQPVTGDLRNRASLDVACKGIETIITTAAARVTEDEATTRSIELQGYYNLIDAAREAEVHHFIYPSALGADPHSPIPYLAYKGKVEEALRLSGIPYTILEPDWIMDSWFMFFVYGQAVQGQPVWVVGEGRDRHGPVAAQDLVAFAVAAIDYSGSRNKVIPICGPQAISLRDMARVCERLLGKPVTLQSFTAGEPPPGWPPLFVQLMLGYATDLFVEIAEVAREFGLRLTSLDEYIKGVLASCAV
jgi:uncharacterized protein YbjT (DUF2867 family)